MNTTLMEELLNEDESSTLDFKRDQYPFDKATPEQKGELLKDILAFANAWRRTDAYILIGVDDVKGGRCNVVGVTSHLDDATVQQFVNGKTNRPVTFSYEVFPFEGVQVGIFHIPMQDRPIYLKKDFGRLKQHVVYIRRGSSTDIATPDEVAKMGSLKIREVLGELPSQPKSNPIIEALRRELEQENVILVEKINNHFDKPRWYCKVVEVNDLYAVFRPEAPEPEISGPINQGDYPLDKTDSSCDTLSMEQKPKTFSRQPNKTQPSIFEVMQRFNTEEKCIKHLENIRWPEGLRCIKCEGANVHTFESEGKTGKERHLYHCRDCRYQYSVTTGTIFHDTHLPLTKWFLAIYMICSAKKGISAKELQRQLSTSYKTAWYMAHRVRLAMQQDDDFCQKFSGVCEVDETYIGGKGKGLRGRSTANKTPVLGIKEKTSGKVRMVAAKDVQGTTLAKFIRNHAEAGAEIHTDEFSGYFWLDSSEYKHKSVKHADEYVTAEGVTTNGVENVWSLFKRGIIGQFHKVSAKYLPLYLDEFTFRFNNRGEYDLMDRVLASSF